MTTPSLQEPTCLTVVSSFGVREANTTLEINNRLSNGEIALHGPWQVEELGRYEFEDFVHVYVVSCTRKEECCVEGLCICSCLHTQLRHRYQTSASISFCFPN